MILDFWKYNGYNEVPLYFHKSEFMIFNEKKINKSIENIPQNVVFLKPLVYCGDICRPILAKKSFYLNLSFPPL